MLVYYLVFLVTTPILKLSRGPQPPVISLHTKESIIQGMPRVLEVLCQQLGQRPNIWFFYCTTELYLIHRPTTY